MCDDKYNVDFTHEVMCGMIERLCADYECISFFSIGKSLFGRSIPCLRFGAGSVNMLYVGAHHGMEWITSILLMRFAEDLCDNYINKRNLYGINADYLYQARSFYIVPILNPDGVELCINGIAAGNPMKDRLVRANNMSDDFSSWQANARGVDLNHNYDAGFAEYKSIESKLGITGAAPTRYSGEYPESEPETQALCKLVRTVGDFKIAMALHTQGEEIYADFNGKYPPRGEIIGKQLARCSGYKLTRADGPAAYGGFKDWYISEFNKPAFTVECGKGKNPLQVCMNAGIYADIRKMLFRAAVV